MVTDAAAMPSAIAEVARRESMRFMMFYRPYDPDAEAGAMPDPAYLERMNSFIADSFKSGHLLESEGLKPSSEGTRIELVGRRATTTDGPFPEAKEVIGGYALMQFDTKAEAIEAAKRFLEVAGDGECEIRPLYEASDFGAAAGAEGAPPPSKGPSSERP